MNLYPVSNFADLWDGEMRGVQAGQTPVVLIRYAGSVYAYQDRCAHQGVALSGGRLEGFVLTCSAHEWKFDVRTGDGINPRGTCLKPYPVDIREGRIYVSAP